MRHWWLRLAFVLSIPITSACHADRAVAPAFLIVPVALTDSGERYIVDTRAGLTFGVNKANCDIVSLRYQGVELQDQSRFSHIGSGLGSSGTQVTAATSADGTVATVTCTTPTLTHYYVARNGTSAIFLATHK